MRRMDLTGLGVALITPFETNGRVDYTILADLIEHQVKNGTDYLVLLGTTAETPTLDKEEQWNVAQFVIERVAGRIPLVMGIGGNNTRAIAYRLKYEVPAGINAILSVVPYYNKPTQEGIYQHYKMLSENSALPIILYNVPSRTGVNMQAETTIRLAKNFENIIGVKEASGDLAQIERLIHNKPDRFQVVSGDDSVALPLITLGGRGVISVLGNAFPMEFGQMIRLALAGKYTEAETLERRFKEFYRLLFVDGNPAGIKALLAEMGMIKNALRLPLVPASKETQESILKTLNSFRNE